jgi:integrase
MPCYYRDKKTFEIVTKEQIEKYIFSTNDEEFRVLLALAWLTGARISELLDLKKQDFLLDQNRDIVMITIRAKKHGRIGYPTFSFSDPFVSDLIIPYINNIGEEQKLFRRSKRRYQQMLLRLNKDIWGENKSKYITFHYLRHSRISFLARILGALPEELKSWTGHRSTAFEEYFAPRRTERFRGKIR